MKNTYPAGLPDYCYAVSPITHGPVKVVKGETTLFGCRPSMVVLAANARLGVDRRTQAAMLGGALQGWRSAYADPAHYDDEGCYVGPETEAADA